MCCVSLGLTGNNMQICVFSRICDCALVFLGSLQRLMKSIARWFQLILHNNIFYQMLVYWKKYEKVEKEHRKRAEKEAMEQRKLDDEFREVTNYYYLLRICIYLTHFFFSSFQSYFMFQFLYTSGVFL